MVEQINLLGGADLLTRTGGGKKRKPRLIHVDRRWKVGFAEALALVVEHGRQQAPDPVPETSRCPRCGLKGFTSVDFGTRVIDGTRRAQSWCRSCRADPPPARLPQVVQEALAFVNPEGDDTSH